MNGMTTAARLLAVLLALVLHAAVSARAVEFGTGQGEITTDEGVISLELEFALTPEQRQRGLMFREELGEFSGMLFDYETPQYVTMWMQNTPLPLDMIFMDGEGVITRIEAYTTPFSRDLIHSGSKVRYVLEVNGGFARAMGVEPGDRFAITSQSPLPN